MDGVALLSCSPVSLSNNLARPNSSPTSTRSPLLSLPSFIRMVATAPLPLSIPDSITEPIGLPSLGAFKSRTSA